MDCDDVFFDRPGSIGEDVGDFSFESGKSVGFTMSDMDMEITTDVATAPDVDYKEDDGETIEPEQDFTALGQPKGEQERDELQNILAALGDLEHGMEEDELERALLALGQLEDEGEKSELRQVLAPLSALEDGVTDHKIEDETGSPNIEDIAQLSQRTRIEVAIPEMPLETRNQYTWAHSDAVEFVIAELEASGNLEYHIEFTDGIHKMVTFTELVALENGKTALSRFGQGLFPDAEMDGLSRKRKRDEDAWNSDDSAEADPMDIDNDDDELMALPRSSRASSRPNRSLRSRETTRQASHNPAHMSDEDEDDLTAHDEPLPSKNTRALRTRQLKQATLTGMYAKSDVNSLDELLQSPQVVSTDEEDGDFALVTSDLVHKPGRPNRARQRSKRVQAHNQRVRSIPQPARHNSADSDIEFEAPRRSARSTRNKAHMLDDALMDEDSFYVVDDTVPGIPKAISVREIFPQLPAESPFASIHMATCHTCGMSKQRGQMVHCQGCTMSYHKNCLGYRSGREHMVTKVGEENFVLQCKFCIEVHHKKDANAPRYCICQGCGDLGRACAPFSEKKTARQEEKLREQNDGTDPITPVAAELLNNSDLVLFRCTTCHRGWHLDHLPGPAADGIGTDLKSERFKDYSIDWRCHECGTAKSKINRLVAWRPTDAAKLDDTELIACTEVSEDQKEYLVKWELTSYNHCVWVPGAWVYGVAPTAMRSAFGKRDAERSLLSYTEDEAIPDEFLMPDVIMNIKFSSSASRAKTKEEELANINKVSKIFVKFQGLGYDEVVWDSPPSVDAGEIYTAYAEAFFEYVEGKYFQSVPAPKIRERIAAFKKSPFTEVEAQPLGLKRGKLMGYQLEGLNWLLENYHSSRSVVLADEMGLGKTVQVVSLVTSLVQDKPHCWPFLIAVPNSTCPNWRREFKQWAPDLRVVTYHGGKEPQELAYKYELFPNNSSSMKAHVVIMSYDSAQDPRTRVLFKSVNWAGLVVDEGQRLKNDQNLLYVALREMKIPFRLLLTGTPLQNNKRELFNLIQFIDDSQNALKLDTEFEVLDKETLPKLHEKIRPYFLRRTKAGVLKFLPPMAQIILPVSMTVVQEKLSKSIMAKNPELIKSIFANGKMNKKERGSLNNILMQLRKCLCHPFMYSEAIEEKHQDPAILQRNLVEASAKLMLLELMLPRLKEKGHRVLIFSQFLQQLDIIEDFLGGMGYDFRRLDGQIGSMEKQRRIDAFNAPDSPVFAFLLSTRAGGVGINLATADTVIIMDPDFNPHQDMQALSRAHRIGQKKKVLCFQLVTKDSVEERIMQAGRKKMALDHALIESMDDDELAGDDLESILKHGAQALFNDDYQKEAIHYDAASVDKLLDRSEVEQTKTDEEGSTETQFTYARVWANEKSAFEEGLATEEETAPLALNSSVWDTIIAQREEEARKEAEANREVLGRGGRRRTAINYKTNAIDAIPAEDVGAESSDSSDDFVGADIADESDDEAQGSPTKDAQYTQDAQQATRKATQTDNVDPQTKEKRRQAATAATAAADAKQKRPQAERGQNLSQQRKPEQTQNKQTKPSRALNKGGTVVPGYVDPRQDPAQPFQYGQGYTNGTQDHRPDFARYLKYNYYQPNQRASTSQASTSNQPLDYKNVRLTEAQVRLALDSVHHSRQKTPEIRQREETMLRSHLQVMKTQNGTQQRGTQQRK